MREMNVEAVIEDIRRRAGKVMDGVTDFTKTTAKRTNSVIGVTKLRFAKNEIEESIAKTYEEIGKAVFAEYTDDEPFSEDIIEKCIVVEKYMAELQSVKEKIAACTDSVLCAECGAKNAADSVYCSKCGKKIVKEDYHEEFEDYDEYTEEEPSVIEIKPKKSADTDTDAE